MDKREVLKHFGNRKWIYLIEYPEVWNYVKDYQNLDTILDVLRSLNRFEEQKKEKDPNYKITDILKLSPLDATNDIWSIVEKTMTWDKSHREARKIKVFMKQFYETHWKSLGENKEIVFIQRRHRISIIPQKKLHEYTPRHNDIFLIASHCRLLRDKALVLLMYNTGLLHKALCNLKMKHLRPILEKYAQDKEIPMILKITAEIMPKRFKSNANRTWLPCFIDKDCADILLKYYIKKRKNADDEDYFFINRDGNKLERMRVSKQLKNAMRRASEVNPMLENAVPKGIRMSFNNRLLRGHMNNEYKEFLMHHSEGIKEAYFSLEYQQQYIIPQYLKCGFNRETSDVIERLADAEEKFDSQTRSIIERLADAEERMKLMEYEDVPKKKQERTIEVEFTEPRAIVVDKHDLEEQAKLLNLGYSIKRENDTKVLFVKE